MKKVKLKIDELKVQSFMTSLDVQKTNTIKGGELTEICPVMGSKCKSVCFC